MALRRHGARKTTIVVGCFKVTFSPQNLDIKSGPNLVSDRFFDFLKNLVPGGRLLPTALFIPQP